MSYAPRGFAPSEVGDVEVVARGPELHLFHLTLPNHDVVGHAVSTDGIAWEPRPAALRTGEPGAPDDDQIWTMGVAPIGDVHHMLYTALDRAGDGRVQRTALAVSDDLSRWTKRGVVAEADPAHYEVSDGPWVSWRDPKPVRHGDGWIAPLCARERDGPWLRRGAVGLLRSSDGDRWEVEPPIFAPRRYFELECPQLIERAGRWFLLASVIDDRRVRYWVADDPRGPFEAPDDNALLPPGAYAARVVRFKGCDLLFAVHERLDGDHLHKVVSSPLRLVAEGERLGCAPASELWAPRFGPWVEVTTRGLEPLLTPGEGAQLWALPQTPAEVELELRATPRGDGWGLFVGVADDLSGLFVELDGPTLRLVEVGRVADPRPWFRRRVLQETAIAGAVTSARLRASDGEVELTINGRTALFSAAPTRRGRAGLFVESGRLDVEPLRVRERAATV